jgi:acyl-CoA thioester hydrolase
MVSEMRGEWRDGWYIVPHHVIFRDLDPFGHVNNSVFFTYFEWARALLWWEITGVRGPREIGFIVAHAACDFRSQLGLEPIDICVRISDMRTTSMVFLHEIRKQNGNDVAASGKVIVVLFDWARQSKVQITDELRRKVAAWSTDAS